MTYSEIKRPQDVRPGDLFNGHERGWLVVGAVKRFGKNNLAVTFSNGDELTIYGFGDFSAYEFLRRV